MYSMQQEARSTTPSQTPSLECCSSSTPASECYSSSTTACSGCCWGQVPARLGSTQHSSPDSSTAMPPRGMGGKCGLVSSYRAATCHHHMIVAHAGITVADSAR
jgi:hypothetical protein